MVTGMLTEVGSLSAVWEGASKTSLLAWTYLLVFGTLLTYTAYLWLVRNVSPPLAGSGAFVNPLIAVAIGAYAAGEKLDSLSLLAVALILVALGLILTIPRGAPAPSGSGAPSSGASTGRS